MNENNNNENGSCTAREALERLKEGNARYLRAERSEGDISFAVRKRVYEMGQRPYAVVITCSDSMVAPEYIFSAGLGELFVIRTAGNVIDDYQAGSVEYAVEHLGCRLVVVMGHERCGAVSAAMSPGQKNYTKRITDEIKSAIGEEADADIASCLNVRHSVNVLEEKLGFLKEEIGDLQMCGAMYWLSDGSVEFFDA